MMLEVAFLIRSEPEAQVFWIFWDDTGPRFKIQFPFRDILTAKMDFWRVIIIRYLEIYLHHNQMLVQPFRRATITPWCETCWLLRSDNNVNDGGRCVYEYEPPAAIAKVRGSRTPLSQRCVPLLRLAHPCEALT